MRHFGLIGKSLEHSFSKDYFENKFKLEAINNANYNLFEIKSLSLLPELITQNKLVGLNVTIPYKEEILPYLNSIDDTAKKIGAVNTIHIDWSKEKPLLTGYNTDFYGFKQAIKPFLEAKHQKALILGTGGSSKAIAFVLQQLGIDFLFVSRNPVGENQISYSNLNEYLLQHFLFIINCTPLGTYPNFNNKPEIPYQYITSNHFLFDLTYNPKESAFLQEGKSKNALIKNGLDMLKHKAEKSWEIWN